MDSFSNIVSDMLRYKAMLMEKRPDYFREWVTTANTLSISLLNPNKMPGEFEVYEFFHLHNEVKNHQLKNIAGDIEMALALSIQNQGMDDSPYTYQNVSVATHGDKMCKEPAEIEYLACTLPLDFPLTDPLVSQMLDEIQEGVKKISKGSLHAYAKVLPSWIELRLRWQRVP